MPKGIFDDGAGLAAEMSWGRDAPCDEKGSLGIKGARSLS
jgi:hypothetical protein